MLEQLAVYEAPSKTLHSPWESKCSIVSVLIFILFCITEWYGIFLQYTCGRKGLFVMFLLF